MTIDISYRNKSEVVQLPSTWRELHRYMDDTIVRSMLSLSPWLMRTMVAARVLRKYGTAVLPEHVAMVAEQMKWVDLTDMRDYDWSKGMTLWVWRRYAMCKEMMENATMREWILADEYLKLYVEAVDGGDTAAAETNLYRLLATVCRPVNADIETSIKLNDARVPLSGREQVEYIAAALQRHGGTWVYGRKIRYAASVALMTVLATKNFIAKNYMPHLVSEGGGERAANFGWNTVVMDIGENGAYGSIDDVYQAQLHDIMVFCVKKAMDAAAMKAAVKPN